MRKGGGGTSLERVCQSGYPVPVYRVLQCRYERLGRNHPSRRRGLSADVRSTGEKHAGGECQDESLHGR